MSEKESSAVESLTAEEMKRRFLSKREVVTEEVMVKGDTWTIRKITNPTVLIEAKEAYDTIAENQAAQKVAYGRIPSKMELWFYHWLSAALVSPKLSVAEIVRGSEDDEGDCLKAGYRAAELAGVIPKNPEEGPFSASGQPTTDTGDASLPSADTTSTAPPAN